jgi:Na+-transporting methylmalonyl-CoA/oxaloacetate decarboxylase gamma subunit
MKNKSDFKMLIFLSIAIPLVIFVGGFCAGKSTERGIIESEEEEEEKEKEKIEEENKRFKKVVMEAIREFEK